MLSSYSPSLINFRKEMLSSFVETGCEVHAVGPEMPLDTKQQLEEMDCVPEEIQLQRTGLNPLSDITTLYRLCRMFRRTKPDIFLGYTIKPVVYGTLAAWLARVPKRVALVTGLGISFNFDDRGLKGLAMRVARGLYKTAIRKSHLVLFQNPDDLQRFRDLGFIKNQEVGIVNGSGVDISRFSPQPLPEKPVYLLVARLLEEKGVRDFVEAAAIVKEELPESRFLIAGFLDKGPSAITEAELNSWIESGTIEFLGMLKDIRPAFEQSNVFVLPSYYGEGTPRTILEAMAMQRPVITCDTTGCREPIEDGESGILVSPKSPRELATAMIRLGGESQLRVRMAKRGREIAEERYDVHKVNASINEYLGLS